MAKRVRAIVVASAMVLAACAPSESDSVDPAVEDTVPVVEVAAGEADADVPVAASDTSVPVPVTVPWKKGEAAKAWKKFLRSYEVLDVSDYSGSECGLYTMMLTEGSVTFYFWDGRGWVDQSQLLGSGQGRQPVSVHSADYTNDGVIDFFITYAPDRDYGNREYGAYFAIPWGGNYRCQWGWVDVDDGRTLGKRITSPDVSTREAVVRGDGFDKGRWRTWGEYRYLPSSASFVFRKVQPDN
ncbi:MAG: hypothetical protein RLY50_683 [Actinomycetota bacterium]